MVWKLTLVIAAVLVFSGAWFFEFLPGGAARKASLLNIPEISVPRDFPPLSVSFRDVKAIYATALTVSSPRRVAALLDLIRRTELNALVVDVKDSDGVYLGKNMEQVVAELRVSGIYPIARVLVFQDNDLAARKPEFALRNASGELWTSGGGKYRWVDPASRDVWNYAVAVTRRALDIGFAEVNFDYIRFPSDGDIQDIVYPVYDEVQNKNDTIAEFFRHLTSGVKKTHPQAILSADLFAYSFLRTDGLGVGQRLSDAAAAFDVISPMIYPSHYAAGNFGFESPAKHPYEVVRQTLEAGYAFLAGSTSTAIVRPWVQDFDLRGVPYGPVEVRTEIIAVKDGGAGDTWMVWNSSNRYDSAKFLPAE